MQFLDDYFEGRDAHPRLFVPLHITVHIRSFHLDSFLFAMHSCTFSPAFLFTAAFNVLLATLATATPSAVEARTPCYSGVYTIMARGTYEVQGQSVLEPIGGAIAAAIPGSGLNEVVYPANYSFWPSVPVGVANAQQQMQDYYDQCPDGKMVIMGYSQGAYVMAVTLAGGNPSGSDDFQPIATDIGNNGELISPLNCRALQG